MEMKKDFLLRVNELIVSPAAMIDEVKFITTNAVFKEFKLIKIKSVKILQVTKTENLQMYDKKKT